MRAYAAWANVGLFTEDFYRIWEGEGAALVYEAFLQDLEEDAKRKDMLQKSVFWVGNILSHFGTVVLKFLGVKMDGKSLADLHLYEEWKANRKSWDDVKEEARNPQNWINLQ